MKPSEVGTVVAPAETPFTLEYPCSSRADPPITIEEARTAKLAVCPRHNGLIKVARNPFREREGSVHFCPVAEEYWRLRLRRSYSSLRYQQRYLSQSCESGVDMLTRMSADEFLSLHDKIETEPPELGSLFVEVMTASLAKMMAEECRRPWSAKQEAGLQEKIAALVGAAQDAGLSTITVMAVKPDGERVAREISIDKLSEGRVLQ
jgi:hypothetical protein